MATKNTSADNRTMATDAVATIGMLIPEGSGRDAIHLATEPVIAGERLHAGQHIGFLPDGTVGTAATELLGIVDPFLTAPVFPGNRFWLVVYPRTITSLRHVWEHPSFSSEPVALGAPAIASSKAYSEEWMRRWAVEHMSYDYYGDEDKHSPETAYGLALDAGRRMNVGPYENARDHINSEWWDHWEAITGERGQRDEYFSCAC